MLFPICMLESGVSSYKYRPTTVGFTITGTNTAHSNDANAYDIVSGYSTTTDTTTYAIMSVTKATVNRGTNGMLTAIYSGFSGTYTYLSGQTYGIAIRANITTASSTSSDSTTTASSYVYIDYSLNGGSTFASGLVYQYGAGASSSADVTFSIGTSVTFSSLQIRITTYGESNWDGSHLSSVASASASVNLYDIMLM